MTVSWPPSLRASENSKHAEPRLTRHFGTSGRFRDWRQRFDKLFTGIVIGPPDRPSFIDDTDQSGKGGIGPEDTGELG